MKPAKPNSALSVPSGNSRPNSKAGRDAANRTGRMGVRQSTLRKRPVACASRASAKEDIREELDTVISELFAFSDRDSSGHIHFGEFLTHHQNVMSLAGMNHLEDADVEKYFRDCDTDNSHSLNKAEFAAYMDGVFNVVGKRVFLDVCHTMLKEESQRREFKKEAQNRDTSMRLVEQARMAHHYKAEMMVAAEQMLTQKADPNFTDPSGSHVLLHAVEKSDPPFIAKLLLARANPMLHNNQMECAPLRAAAARKVVILSLMLLPPQATSDPEAVELEAREKASQDLVRGMAQFSTSDVRELLNKRADINHKDENTWTPLTAAVFWDKRDLVDIFVKTVNNISGHRLRINSRNGMGRTALHVAARKGLTEIAPLLLSARGDPDIQDCDGWTPLHHAAFNGMDDAVHLLVAASANLLAQGAQGHTPWMVAKLPTRAGCLGEKAMKMLEPSENLNFSKVLIPILKADSKDFDKLEAMLDLRGVKQVTSNLRLYEQFFDPRTGPNKVRLQKIWEGLALPMIRRLRTGETDLAPPPSNVTDEVRNDNALEQQRRRKEQRNFVRQWLIDTKGPAPTPDWSHDNRRDYRDELKRVLAEELDMFQKELDDLYAKMLDMEDGDALAKIPAKEVIDPRHTSQMSVHPFLVWVEQRDVAGAFEALRALVAAGMGKDDDDSLQGFVELVTMRQDFDSGIGFWSNIYKLWLHAYARVIDTEFQRRMRKIVDRFNEDCAAEGLVGTYKTGPVKAYERMKAKEREDGIEADPRTYEGRMVAARFLDVVRGSVTVNSPAAAVKLLNEYFRTLTQKDDKLSVVCVANSFNEGAATTQGYRCIELNIYYNSGQHASTCGRPGVNVTMAIVGEVQIVLEDFIAVKKRRHLVYACSRGDYDWTP